MYYVQFVILGLVVVANVVSGGINGKPYYRDFLHLLLKVREPKMDDGNLCCTPLPKLITIHGYEELRQGPCKNMKDGCEIETCILRNKGLMVGDEIDEKKCLDELKEFALSNPETVDMVDNIIRECLDDKYKDYLILRCPAIQLKSCYYMVGSMHCPDGSCDQTGGCQSTCTVFKDMYKLTKYGRDKYSLIPEDSREQLYYNNL